VVCIIDILDRSYFALRWLLFFNIVRLFLGGTIMSVISWTRIFSSDFSCSAYFRHFIVFLIYDVKTPHTTVQKIAPQSKWTTTFQWCCGFTLLVDVLPIFTTYLTFQQNKCFSKVRGREVGQDMFDGFHFINVWMLELKRRFLES
jgi:hypothetical protein